jgi:uncharacterized protein YpbB
VRKKKKSPKGETNRITLEMFKAGKTIDEIANQRGLAPTTICTHLLTFINIGFLDINQFISEEKRNKALELMQQTDETGSAYQMLSSVLVKYEVNFFLSWIRSRKDKL